MTKKKILYISQVFPYPPDGGGKIKTLNTLKTLAKEYNLFAVFISEKKPTTKEKIIFEKYNIKYKIFHTNIMSEDIKKNYKKLALNYLKLTPHYVYQYSYQPAFDFIKNKIKSFQPNVIHIDHINSSQYLPKKKWLKNNIKIKYKLILENHNIVHKLYFSRILQTKKIVRIIYLLIEGNLNYLYGKKNYKKYDTIFTISNSETNYLKNSYKNVFTQKLVWPLSKTNNFDKKIYDLLFIGYLEWPPNEEAINWYHQKVIPLLKRKSNSILHIIGKNNPKLSYLENNKNLIFHGYKKSINKFLERSKVFVMPFKSGAGVRIKALTAMSAGIPLVSTTLGVQGLNVKHGKEALITDNPKKFYLYMYYLINNESARKKMGRHAKNYISNNHSEINNKEFLEQYEKSIIEP